MTVVGYLCCAYQPILWYECVFVCADCDDQQYMTEPTCLAEPVVARKANAICPASSSYSVVA